MLSYNFKTFQIEHHFPNLLWVNSVSHSNLREKEEEEEGRKEGR